MEENSPQGFFMPTPVSGMSLFFKFLFNFKTISFIVVAALALTIYIQQNKIDSYKFQLESQVAKAALIENDLTYCRANFQELKLSVENAAVESKKLNEEFFDLKTEIERFNNINRNNSKQIDDIRNSALANTCDDAIKELVEAIEGDK
jgi:predicted  nucleic acid-binding Zn-ribbon protein